MPTVNLMKLPDPAAQTAKYVNMMNATKQQEAAEQTLKLQQERGAREEALQPAALAKGKTDASVAQLDYVMKFFNASANDIANARDPEQAMARGERLKQQFPDPALQKRIDETIAELVSDPSQFEANRTRILTRTLAAKEQLAVTHSDIFDMEGNLYNKETSPIGAFPTRIMPGVVTGPADTGAAPAPAPRTPTAPQAATPNPFAPGYEPNTAAAAPNSLSLVVDSALETGVMAKADFDKLVSIAQPGSGPKLEAWARQHNITIAPNAPGVTDNQVRGAPANLPSQMAVSPMSYDGRTPPSQFADMRGPAPQASFANLDGAPPMQNTMAQYQVGQQIKGRDPRVSPAPGIYGVPTQDVAATSRATRPSKQELYDAEAAKIQAARDAGPPPVTAQQKIARKSEVAQAYSKAQTLIDKAYNPKEGIISIANKIKSLSDDQKEAITGYSGYVPSFRESSREADTLFGNLKGVVTSLGKDAAAASGAVGNMAVQEWKIAADMIANLDLAGMTPRALDAQMDRIIEQVSNATKLAERVYGIQYGEDVKQYPAFKLRGTPPARTKTPVAKGGSNISPDIDKILKSRGI
jgi:hypothetical protein